LWHALFVVPFVLLRVLARRVHYALVGSRAELHSSLLDVAQVTAELP
jgi:hypothetical protein